MLANLLSNDPEEPIPPRNELPNNSDSGELFYTLNCILTYVYKLFFVIMFFLNIRCKNIPTMPVFEKTLELLLNVK